MDGATSEISNASTAQKRDQTQVAPHISTDSSQGISDVRFCLYYLCIVLHVHCTCPRSCACNFFYVFPINAYALGHAAQTLSSRKRSADESTEVNEHK